MKEIIRVEKKTNGKLMYGFNHRAHRSVVYMKKLIDSKKFGKILWMRGRYGKSVNNDFFKSWRSKKKYAGGGILIDQGIHMLDLFLYLSGSFDIIKSSIGNQYWKCDVEDNAFVILENSKTKVSASLHSTMTQWRHLFSLEIFLQNGYLVLNGLKTSSNSYGDEMNQLLSITDVLITDYSSLFADYLIYSKPIVFANFDHDAYLEEKKLSLDYDNDLPGIKVQNWRDMLEALSDILIKNNDTYKDKRNEMMHKIYPNLDGKARERIAKFIMSPLKTKENYSFEVHTE